MPLLILLRLKSITLIFISRRTLIKTEKFYAIYDLQIVHPETGKVLGPNQEGEVCVKSVMIMKGYIGKKRQDDFDNEGFFKTGDIGYYDEDKYLYIVDRLKELIKYKAHQVCIEFTVKLYN